MEDVTDSVEEALNVEKIIEIILCGKEPQKQYKQGLIK